MTKRDYPQDDRVCHSEAIAEESLVPIDMMKKIIKFIFIIAGLSVITIAGVKGVEDLGQFEPQGEGFGQPTCDRIIHIGEPLQATALVLADVYDNFQKAAGYVESASKILTNVYAQLSKDQQFICDFSLCNPLVVDAGPDFGLDIDLLLKQYAINGHAGLPNNKECQGSPCPDLGDDATGVIGSLIAWRAAIDGSRGYVKAIFDRNNPTVPVTWDLVSPDTQGTNAKQGCFGGGTSGGGGAGRTWECSLSEGDVGQRITRADYAYFRSQQAANEISSCTLSEFEQKMVLSGRQGEKFPMACEQALEIGAYWPFAWSRACDTQCKKEDNSDKCIECLKTTAPDSGTASDIEMINYKIYNQCEKKCYHENSGGWYLDDACYDCLCTVTEISFSGNDQQEFIEQCNTTCKDKGYHDEECEECLQTILLEKEQQNSPKTVETKLTDKQCKAWICGGSIYNWACCHQETLEETAAYYETTMHHPDLPIEAATYGLTFTGGLSGEGQEFVLTAYAPPCFCKGRCTAKGSSVGLGTIAVFTSNIPHKSLVTISGTVEKAVFNNTTNKYEHTGTFSSFDMANQMKFCACDTGGDIKNGRIDVWMSNLQDAKDFGLRFAKVEWKYNEDCCKPNKCCQKTNQMSTECQKFSGGVSAGWRCGCDNEDDCKEEAISEWNDLFKKFSSIPCR